MSSAAADVVRGIFEAITREDMPALLSLLDEQIEVVEPDSLPCGGVHRGREAFRKNVMMVMGRKFRVRASNCSVIGAGDTVAATADLEFTSRATGRTLLMPYVEIHTVCGGRSCRALVYPQDTHKLVEFSRNVPPMPTTRMGLLLVIE